MGAPEERARRKKGGDEKKAMVAFLGFILATLRYFLAERNCWTEKNVPFQPFGVFKNPARVCTVTNVYEINHI